MKKNAHIHFVIEKEFLDKLTKEAEKRFISISELCRIKLRDNMQLDRIELYLNKIMEQNERKS